MAVDQAKYQQLQDELNELLAAQGKKQKLTPQQQQQLVTLSKANEGDGNMLKLLATASFVELNLFGTMANFALKAALLVDATTTTPL